LPASICASPGAFAQGGEQELLKPLISKEKGKTGAGNKPGSV